MTKSKHIPKRRFSGFDGEWEQNEFGKMCQRIQTGTTLLGSEQGKGIPLLKMGNIQRGYWDFTKLERLNQEIECENIIKYGDFLFNTRNTLELVGKGATWFIKEGLYGFNSNLARVTLDDVDTIFFNYLYNIPESIQQVKSRAVGTTSVAAIYPKDMSTIKFNLPTINEQNKLGNFFQTIDRLITLHQHKLDKLKNLKKSYLAELFPPEGERVPKRRFPGFEGEWEEKKLNEVIKDFIVPMRDKPKEFSGNIPWTRIEDIEGKYISKSHIGYCVSSETIKRMNLKIIPEGSLIVSASATFGVVAIVKNDLITNQTFIGLVPQNGYEIEFLYYLFQSPKIRAYMKEESAGSTIFYISRESFENMDIELPNEQERKLIIKQLNTLDSLLSLQQQKLDKLKDLKKAYLNELFV